MSEITYDDKVDLQVATNIANINKVTASDMNEIKNVVNGNADEVGDITSLTTTDKTSVVNAVNELNAPEKWVSVGATAPTDGRRVWFSKGKNLFDIDSAYHGTISGTGGEGRNEDYRTSYYIATTPNTTYYFSSTQISGQTSKQLYLAYYDSNKTFLSRTSYNLYESAFTTPSNCYYIRAGVYSAGQENVMLELGSQKTTYEPYVDQGIYVDNEQWYIKPKILWSGRATSVSVNLTGYSLIEVIFCSNDNFYNSLKVPVSGSTFLRKLALCNNYMPNTMESSSSVFLKYGLATLTQAGITINSNVEIPFSNTAGQIRWQGATNTLLYITTIIGYK